MTYMEYYARLSWEERAEELKRLQQVVNNTQSAIALAKTRLEDWRSKGNELAEKSELRFIRRCELSLEITKEKLQYLLERYFPRLK